MSEHSATPHDGPFGDLHNGPPVDRVARIRAGLLTAILEQRLAPGTKLGEDEIGVVYNCSRTLVRTALQQLAHEGIVIVEKNRGAFVASPSPKEAREVFEARQLLETAVIARAVANIDDDGLRRLGDHLEQERDADRRGDKRASIRLSGEFHLLVAEIAGHEIYITFLRHLIARSSLIILLYRSARVHVCGADHHAEIVTAIAARDTLRARKLMLHHLYEIEAELDLSGTERQESSLADILKG